MLADCFTFYNELDLLEIRLHELDPVVDRFVLCEATETFTGIPKKLFYAENKQRYAKWAHKIRHVVVEDMPHSPDAWINDWHQRNSLVRGVDDLAPDDLVMLSDVDEIPKREVVAKVRAEDLARGRVVTFEETLHHYRLDFRVPPAVETLLIGTKLVEKRYFQVPKDVRQTRVMPTKQASWATPALQVLQSVRKLGAPLPHVLLRDAGWHLTYMGDHAFYVNKIKSFAHQEFNKAEWLDPKRFEDGLLKGEFVLGPRHYVMERVAIDTLPHLVREHPERFRHLLAAPA
jgi:beta-1,4-mannosyl-glycoprotein beta-1,4-N-acetylglucosaminyltransferase